MTRTERICIAIRMLAQEPGWVSVASYIEATDAPLYAARLDLRLVRGIVDLEEHRSGRHRAWTLPGAARPPMPVPQPRMPRPRKPRPSRSTGLTERYRAQGLQAYELAATGASWRSVAVAVGYASSKSAWLGARHAARRHSLPWPLKYTARGSP